MIYICVIQLKTVNKMKYGEASREKYNLQRLDDPEAFKENKQENIQVDQSEKVRKT